MPNLLGLLYQVNLNYHVEHHIFAAVSAAQSREAVSAPRRPRVFTDYSPTRCKEAGSQNSGNCSATAAKMISRTWKMPSIPELIASEDSSAALETQPTKKVRCGSDASHATAREAP
jgi:hypothetical protein